MIRTCSKCGEDYGDNQFCRCTRRLVFIMVVGCCSAILITGWVIGAVKWPAPKKENSYNHQRVTDQHIAAIAKEAKSRGWKYIRTEDGR